MNFNYIWIFILSFSVYVYSQEYNSDIKSLRETKAITINNDKNASQKKTTIGAENLNYSTSNDISNIIKNNFIGLDFFQGKIQFNGLGSYANRLLYNGIPLIGRDKEAIELDLIDYFFLDQIILIKGASSAFYGSGAVAGVINLISTEHLKNHQIKLKTESYYSFNGYGGVKMVNGFQKKKLNLKYGIGYEINNGLKKEENGYEVLDIPSHQRLSGMLNIGYEITRRDQLAFNLLNAYEYSKNESGESQDYDLIKNKNNFFGNVKYNKTIDYQNEIEMNVSYQQYFINSQTMIGNQELGEDLDKERGNMIYHNGIFHLENKTRFFNWLFLNVGGDFIINGTNNNLLNTISDKSKDRVDEVRYEGVITTQLLFNFDRTYIFSMAFRNTYHSVFGYNISPNISFKYDYRDKVILALDYGRSFITPSFRDNYYKWLHPPPGRFLISGNTDLKPETSDNVSVSLEYKMREWMGFEAEPFFYKFYDKIDQSQTIDDNQTGIVNGKSYSGVIDIINKYGYIRTGLNFKIRGHIYNDVFSYHVGYSYVYAIEKESKENPYKKSLNISPHRVSVGLGFIIPKSRTRLNVGIHWSDKRQYMITTTSGYEETETDYFINLSFSVIQPIYKYFNFYLKIDNLLDRKDSNFLTQEGIDVLLGFLFKADDLRKVNNEVKTKTLEW